MSIRLSKSAFRLKNTIVDSINLLSLYDYSLIIATEDKTMDLINDVFANNNAIEVLMKLTHKSESEVFQDINDVLVNFPGISRNFLREARQKAVKQAIFDIYPKLTVDQQRKALDMRL